MITENDFQFCPSCKGSFIKKEVNLLVCSNCNLHYYLNPKPTNAIVLKNENGQILMVKRKDEPHKGKLDLAGGFVDIKETMEESVIREVKEELGISISEFTYVTSFHETYEHGGLLSDTVCCVFEGLIPPNARLVPSDDAESIEFFEPNEIPYNDMAFKGMVYALQKYVERFI